MVTTMSADQRRRSSLSTAIASRGGEMPAAWQFCAFMSCLVQTVWSQGSVSLTFSKDPIYNGEDVTLICSFGKRMSLRIFTLEAFNGTRRAGFVRCTVNDNATADGIFEGMTVEGCSAVLPGYFRIAFRASPALELGYMCSVRVSDDNSFYNWTSSTSRLILSVLPEVPRLAPYKLMFNESDDASVICESRNGKPSAHLNLTVSTSKSVLKMATGIGSVLLPFSSPLDLRNATASCTVINHNSANMTTMSSIIVNYIFTRQEKPIEANTNLRAVTEDCSAAIESFPRAIYKWQIPTEATFAEPTLNTSIITIPKGLSGLFKCTATNIITLKSVVVTYQAINENNTVSSLKDETQFVVIGSITILLILGGIIIIILYIRGKRQNWSTCVVPAAENSNDSGGESEKDTLAETRMKPSDRSTPTGYDVPMTDNVLYERWPFQTTDDSGIRERLFTTNDGDHVQPTYGEKLEVEVD